MNSEYVIQFEAALRRGDDASALSLLEKGRVTKQSVYIYEDDGIRHSAPLIFPAVKLVRAEVVRALVQIGASIDSFAVTPNGCSFTPAGDAIFNSNIPALSLCLTLGASISCAVRSAQSPPKSCSVLEVAIGGGKHVPLTFLLDGIYAARPICLNGGEVAALATLAVHGSAAISCYKVLQIRGFNFSCLEETKFKPSDEYPDATSFADILLVSAQQSGASDLMRYLVKDLGIVSAAGRMKSLKNIADRGYALYHGDGVTPPRADLSKYKCSTCEVVGATKVCSGCKASRYCSTNCQTDHWKTGGHKKNCKEIRRLLRSKVEGKAGSYGAAGSNKS